MNDDWLDRRAYPFTSYFLDLPAGSLHYVDEGDGDPVVMVHGNPAWSFLYRDLIKRLRSRYRCIAMDHLGFGLSEKPADWSYLPADHAANLTVLLDHLRLKDITLVLHDWGGPIGLSYALDHPRHIARIVLTNTWAWPVNFDPRFAGFSAFAGGPIGRMLIRRYNFFATTLFRAAFGDRCRLEGAVHRQYLHPLADPRERRGCMVFPKQIVGATKWLRGLWERLPVLSDRPVLLIWGMKDIAFRERELRRWQQVFPHARVVRLDGVGHYVQEEAPDEFAGSVGAFLAKRDNP